MFGFMQRRRSRRGVCLGYVHLYIHVWCWKLAWGYSSWTAFNAIIHWLYQKFYGTSTPNGSYSAKTGSPLDDDDDFTEYTRQKCHGSTVWELHCLRTPLCESIRYQAKSEQNVRQDLIPRVLHGEAALCTPMLLYSCYMYNIWWKLLKTTPIGIRCWYAKNDMLYMSCFCSNNIKWWYITYQRNTT